MIVMSAKAKVSVVRGKVSVFIFKIFHLVHPSVEAVVALRGVDHYRLNPTAWVSLFGSPHTYGLPGSIGLPRVRFNKQKTDAHSRYAMGTDCFKNDNKDAQGRGSTAWGWASQPVPCEVW